MRSQDELFIHSLECYFGFYCPPHMEDANYQIYFYSSINMRFNELVHHWFRQWLVVCLVEKIVISNDELLLHVIPLTGLSFNKIQLKWNVGTLAQALKTPA